MLQARRVTTISPFLLAHVATHHIPYPNINSGPNATPRTNIASMKVNVDLATRRLLRSCNYMNCRQPRLALPDLPLLTKRSGRPGPRSHLRLQIACPPHTITPPSRNGMYVGPWTCAQPTTLLMFRSGYWHCIGRGRHYTQRARKASARKQLSGTPATPSRTTAASTKSVGSKDVRQNGPVSRSRILSRAFRDPVALVAPRPQCHRRALDFSGSLAPYCIAWFHSLTHVEFSKAYLSAQPAGASVPRCTAGP